MNYHLKDKALLNLKIKGKYASIWIPHATHIVIGQSNSVKSSIYPKRAKTEKIAITKRPTGGEAVLISPRTIIISAVEIGNSQRKPQDIFSQLNQLITASLSDLKIKKLGANGISDLTIMNKKILGSSIYRNQEKYFYHAVLNHSEEPKFIEYYLRHPQREPDYRKKRKHSDFITSILAEGYNIPIEKVKKHISINFHKNGWQSLV